MPDSLRDVLRRRAAESGPASDLTEGALRRARVLGRRRTAAAALGAVAGVAVAGMAAAALVLPGGGSGVPPAGETTAGADDASSASPSPEAEPSGCEGARPGEGGEDGFSWRPLEPSGAPEGLEELPDRLYFVVGLMHPGPYTAVFEGGESTSFDGGEPAERYFVAPDGDRALISGTGADGRSCELSYLELGEPDFEPIPAFTYDSSCPPSWAPDSDRVVISEPDHLTDAESFVFDLTSGERTALPEGVGCSPVWTPDGEYLVGEGTAVRPDGTGRTELEGLGGLGAEGIESVSADLSRACLLVFERPGDGRSVDHCGAYLDLATGREATLPVEEEVQHVVFLPDGSMLITGMSGSNATLYLVDPAGSVADSRELPWTDRDVEWIRLAGFAAE